MHTHVRKNQAPGGAKGQGQVRGHCAEGVITSHIVANIMVRNKCYFTLKCVIHHFLVAVSQVTTYWLLIKSEHRLIFTVRYCKVLFNWFQS